MMQQTTAPNRSQSPFSGPFSRLMLHVALCLSALATLGCGTTVERGIAASGGEPIPGWQFAITYPWGWLDLSPRFDQPVTLGPSGADLALGIGWGERETWGRWALGPAAELFLTVEQKANYDLLVEGRAPDQGSEVVTLSMGDLPSQTTLGETTFTSDWKVARFEIPEPLAPGGHRFQLSSLDRSNASAFLGSSARSAGIRRIGLVPRGSTDFPPVRSASSNGAGSEGSSESKAQLARTATKLVPLLVPQDAASLSIDLESKVTVRGSGRYAALEIAALTMDGRRQLLESVTPQPDGTTIDHLTVDLTGFRGRAISLLFSASLPPEGARWHLSEPRLHRDATAGEPVAVSQSSLSRPIDAIMQPNVILVILDASRADAFSLYGAERPTSPNLDAFAEEGLVFENATADCPYTLCSTPTILTGLSFLRHGVVDRGLKVQESVKTLAERLQQIGYYTIGLSANPNNSTRQGTDQGFDTFRSTWKKRRSPKISRHPLKIHEFATESLAEAPKDQPLFLMTHYVPPHEPYDPDPEYDLFSDPEYTGVVTRNLKRQQEIFQRIFDMGEADIAQFKALYDGNLRMVDAWVQRLFDELDRLDRLDNSLIIVTGDHGEAFYEHGSFGHSSTVYEEMMRVPLIVRLPRGWERPDVDTRRLASLADLTPTILNLVGAPGAQATDGADLLAPPDPDRVVYLRSSQAEGGNAWGARTRTFKAVVDPEGGSLYDLTSDQGETSSRATDNLALYYSLASRIDAAARSAGRGSEGTSEMTQEEIETLKALGYL